MAGEEQYINPIIQAMVQSAILGQRQSEQKQKSEEFKAEQALREKTAAATQKHLEGQTEYQKSLIDQEAERLKQQHDLNMVHSTQLLNELTARGLDLTKIFKPGQPQQDPNSPNTPAPGVMGGLPATRPTVSVPGLGDIDPTGFQTPQGEATRLQAQAKAQTTGKMEAEDPFVTKYKALDAQNRMNEQHQELVNSLNLQAQRGSDARQLERIRAGSEESRTRLTGEYHLKGIEIANGFDPDNPEQSNNVSENLLDSILQGQTDYKALPKARKQQIDALAASRSWTVPTDQKTYAANLNNTTTIQNILNQARDLANGYSRDTPGGTNVSKLTGGLMGGVVPGTDLNAKLDTFKTQAGQLVTTFDNLKRTSDANILRSVTGAFDPKATRQQNLTKINTLADQLNTQTIKNNFRGMPADQVNHILSSHGITDFGGFGQPATPETNQPSDPLGIR